MRSTYVIWLAAAAILWTFLAQAAHAQLPREIASQYRPAVERIRQAYTHASFEGTSKLAYPQEGKFREQQFVMRASGDRRRLDVTTLKQKGMGLAVGSTQMRMATPIGSLNSYLAPGSEVFDDAQETKYDATVAEIDAGCSLYMPYSLDGTSTILDMLLKPGVKITGVKKFKAEGDNLVKIEFEENARYAGHFGTWKSFVVLSPAESWALRGFSRQSGEGSDQIVERAKVTYSGVTDGVPLIESIERETVQGGKPTHRESIQISQAKLGDPDEYYFTSFAF